MEFSRLVHYLEKLENTSSRNEITAHVAELLKAVKPAEIDKVCYLLGGKVLPSYAGVEFNFAERMLIKAIVVAFGVPHADVLRKYKLVGDIGNVAEEIASKQQVATDKHLEIIEVYERLQKLASESGQGSQERKVNCAVELLSEVNPQSSRYIARILVGKMRLGFSDITVLDALSIMVTGDKSLRKKIESAFNVTADVGKIAKKIKTGGVNSLDTVKAEAGIPIRPALAERLPSADKIIEKLGPRVAVEPKYDGFRIQAHIFTDGNKKQVRLYSRNLENVTDMFPEISEALLTLGVQSAVFDTEAIAYNPSTDELLPFQETIQRKRKHMIDEFSKNIPLKLFVHDVLVFNGNSLLTEPFYRRREVLEVILKNCVECIELIPQITTDDPRILRNKFDEYIKDGLEGAMCKKLEVAYQAGGRGFHWVKYKKATEGKLLDTVDCVLMGAYRGRGKRAGFGVGGFLIGIPDNGKFYSLTKLGTGVKDEQFKEMNMMIESIKVDDQPVEYVVEKMLLPDVWVKPKVVLEILADEITVSTNHTAGRVDNGKGFSLRFPRLVRVRNDKNSDQATSVEELKKLYQIQKGLHS